MKKMNKKVKNVKNKKHYIIGITLAALISSLFAIGYKTGIYEVNINKPKEKILYHITSRIGDTNYLEIKKDNGLIIRLIDYYNDKKIDRVIIKDLNGNENYFGDNRVLREGQKLFDLKRNEILKYAKNNLKSIYY